MMRAFRTYRLWEIRRPYGLVVRIGMLTAVAIVLFEMVNMLVMYRYMKLDLYLCLVSVFFLVAGWLLSRRQMEVHSRKKEPTALDEAVVELSSEETAGLMKVMETLSAKEWQILKLVAEGMTNKEIAAAQFIELSTVKSHLNNIYGKLSVSNRKEARVKYTQLAPKWSVIG